MEQEPTQKPASMTGEEILDMFGKSALSEQTFRIKDQYLQGKDFLSVCPPALGLVEVFKSMPDDDPEKKELGDAITLAIDHYLSEENKV